ncbi:hypothetical protein [Fusobacterium sp. PH5-44]|uniref:hypothetical protein n=1 Tax=unclassified Fusobacterium TaxID=2648384 RepID=UPI003D1B6753
MSIVSNDELLLMIGISALKLEFAELINKEGEGGGTKPHTIYTLVEQLYNSVKDGGDIKTSPIYRYKSENGKIVLENNEPVKEYLYQDIGSLKMKGRFVVETYEAG